jgi:nucleoside 2-deoxyribosyltransferase
MKIFLSAPYLQYFSSDAGMNENYRNRMSKIIDVIKEKRITVLSAHIRKSFEVGVDTPEEAVEYDFCGIKNADFLIAFIGDDVPSYGVLMEIGFAAAHKKRIYLFYRATINSLPFLTRGLNIWTETIFVEYLNDGDAKNKLYSLLDNEQNRRYKGEISYGK